MALLLVNSSKKQSIVLHNIDTYTKNSLQIWVGLDKILRAEVKKMCT